MNAKIVVHTFNDEDFRFHLRIELYNEFGGNVHTLSFDDGEPEDANMTRDFNDCFSIASFAKHVFNLGRYCNDMIIEEIEHKTWNTFYP